MAYNLHQFRSLDRGETNIEGELDLKEQSLNSKDVNDFIHNKGLSLQNFNQRFNFPMALEYLERDRQGPPLEGEDRMREILRNAQSFIEEKKLSPTLLEGGPKQVSSNVNFELQKIGELDRTQELLEAYEAYQTLRELFNSYIRVQEEFKQIREEKKVEVNGGDLSETFSEMFQEGKKNWRKMSSGEKVITGVAVLAGAYWLLKSSEENERMKKVKEYIWGGIKVGGALYAVNIGTKLFTGKTLLDTLSDKTAETLEKSDFFPEAFNSKENPDVAFKLRDTIAYLGDKDFMYLAEQYRLAKAQRSTEIEIPGVTKKQMKPADIYAALHLFFSQPGMDVHQLEKKYRQAEPPALWSQVLAIELAESNIKFKGGILEQTGKTLESWAHRGYNNAVHYGGKAWNTVRDTGEKVVDKLGPVGTGATVGAIGGYSYAHVPGAVAGAVIGAGIGAFGPAGYEKAGNLYKEYFGEEGTPEQIRKFKETELKGIKDINLTKSKDLSEFLKIKLADEEAEAFLRTNRSEKYDPSLKVHHRIEGEFHYAIGEAKADGQKGGFEKALNDARKNVKEFYKKTYPAAAKRIDEFVFERTNAFVADVGGGTVRVFIKMPTPGSQLFNSLNAGVSKKPEVEQTMAESHEKFTGFDYFKMDDKEKRAFRLHYGIASDQAQAFEKLNVFFTQRFKHENIDEDAALSRILNSEADKKAALEFLAKEGATPKLLEKMPQVAELLEKVNTMEKEAMDKVQGGIEVSLKFRRFLQDAYGNSVRLAFLGDPEEANHQNYVPGNPGPVLDEYQKFLQDEVENSNANTVPPQMAE